MTTGLPPAGLSPAESVVVTSLELDIVGVSERRNGWRYGSALELLLDVGRLFRPTPWHSGELQGDAGRCYIESVSRACAGDGLAYVEGLAWDGLKPRRHAWCGDAAGAAIDPTWRDPGTAYLGLPVDARTASDLMGHQGGPLLHDGMPLLGEWLRHGVPGELLVDCGRPVPRASAGPSR
ncbi:hypothetical protein ACFVVA_37035 [Kitasatospora sp. NPDC058048]|uniref:hypothetical protein n=1 Tax=Kitasatospora sp. NPDC058048 TaxID=3346313 RepID=UPI0036DA023B